MSEEQSEQQEGEIAKGNALMNALFEAAETDSAQPPDAQLPQIKTLSDIMHTLPEDAEKVEQQQQQQQPQAEPEPEPEPEPATKVGEREVPLQPVQQQPVQQPVQPIQPVQQPVQEEIKPDPEEGLLDEQKERLRLAKIAEQIYKEDPASAPVEYKDLYSKYLDYYKKESDYVNKQMESGGDLEWDDNYKKLKEDLDPKISDTMIRKLEREDIKREISGEIGRQRQEISQLKSQLHKQKVEPQVVQTLKEYTKRNYEESVPEELRQEMDADENAFKESRPFEYEVITNTLKNAERYVAQFEKVNNGLERYDPNKHGQLAKRIENLGQAHKKTAKLKDGKQFLTRSEFSRLPVDQRGSYYTWDADDVKKAFIVASKATINKKVDEIQQKVSKYGVSTSKHQPTAPAVEPTPRTATPRTPPPVGENKGEEVKSNLASMLLD